jgi:hypothetical protein
MLRSQLIASSSASTSAAHPIAEVVALSSGPAPCRCGRFFSEDFDGRWFCRGCEGTDRADITPRLPLCNGPS